mmetsp:Transcript_21133/g.45843  ORF Transcript_21133/g.45843 Transcript_21133/m.45843 type:complete len:212 (+) Transcript_21133:667-1302(+)
MVVPIVDIMGLTKCPTLEECAEHGTTSGSIKSARGGSVNNGKVAVPYTLEQVINYANTLYRAKAFDFGGHDLPSNNFMAFGNGGHLRLQEGDVFEMDVNVVQPLIKNITSEAGRHECHHQRKDILHISSCLKKNDSEGNGHTSHSSQHSRRSHERISARIGKCTRGVIKLMQQMSKEASKRRPSQEGWNKQSRWDCNSIHQGGQSDVGDEE